MPCIWPVNSVKMIVFLVNVTADRYDTERTENQGQKNSFSAVFQQFFPVSPAHGETDTHPGNNEQERYAPDIDQAHAKPDTFNRRLTLDEINKICPGLKNNTDVVDN